MGFDLGSLVTSAVNLGLTAELGPIAGPIVAKMVDPIVQQMCEGVGQQQGGQSPLDLISQLVNQLSGAAGGLQNAFGVASPSPYSAGVVRDHRHGPGGYGGGGYGSGGGVNFGGSGYGSTGTYQQLQANLQSAAQSGDPQQMYLAQQKMDQYNRCWEFMQSEEQAQQKMAMEAIRAVAQSV